MLPPIPCSEIFVSFGAGLDVVNRTVPPMKVPNKLEDGPLITSTFPSDS